jgi:TusA-related sulfurtransferase
MDRPANPWSSVMTTRAELKINARGLSAPGPRLMVETAMAKNPNRFLRVVVSESAAVEDLREYFAGRDADVKVDQVGEDFHVLVDLKD